MILSLLHYVRLCAPPVVVVVAPARRRLQQLAAPVPSVVCWLQTHIVHPRQCATKRCKGSIRAGAAADDAKLAAKPHLPIPPHGASGSAPTAPLVMCCAFISPTISNAAFPQPWQRHTSETKTSGWFRDSSSETSREELATQKEGVVASRSPSSSPIAESKSHARELMSSSLRERFAARAAVVRRAVPPQLLPASRACAAVCFLTLLLLGFAAGCSAAAVARGVHSSAAGDGAVWGTAGVTSTGDSTTKLPRRALMQGETAAALRSANDSLQWSSCNAGTAALLMNGAAWFCGHFFHHTKHRW